MILVGFMALIMPGSTEQLVIGFSFSLIYMLFTALVDPYVHNDDDLFCTICNFVLTAAIFLCGILKQSVLSEAVASTLSDVFREQFVFDAGLISVLLISMIVGCAIVALLFTAYQLTAAAKVPQFRIRATMRHPKLDLDEGRIWHLFLSHICKRSALNRAIAQQASADIREAFSRAVRIVAGSTGQDQNATIKRQLQLYLPGVAIFLDVRIPLESARRMSCY